MIWYDYTGNWIDDEEKRLGISPGIITRYQKLQASNESFVHIGGRVSIS
jgi:hypothetical protein